MEALTEAVFAAAVQARMGELRFYSPYNFLRAFAADRQVADFVAPRLAAHQRGEGAHRVFSTIVGGDAYHFLYTPLAWDSEFFQRPVIRLYTVLYTGREVAALAEATEAFRVAVVDAQPGMHCFAEVPSEDIGLIQALGRAGFGTVETRCFFYKDDVAAFDHPRYPVRMAVGEADAVRVGIVSAEMRNAFDRFHADAYLTPAKGDAFLRTYAEAAVRGYCDAVLVPDEAVAGVPLDSFLAISDLNADAATLGVGLTRVVLTAVGPQNKGWHLKLVAETVQRARILGATYALMTTQSTNRAVFRTAEKLGWKLGGTGHVLSVGSRQR